MEWKIVEGCSHLFAAMRARLSVGLPLNNERAVCHNSKYECRHQRHHTVP